MNDTSENRNVTTEDLILAATSLAILLIPIFLLVVFPENRIVATTLGGGRVIIFWIVIYGAVWIFRKKIDRYFASRARQRRNR